MTLICDACGSRLEEPDEVAKRDTIRDKERDRTYDFCPSCGGKHNVQTKPIEQIRQITERNWWND